MNTVIITGAAGFIGSNLIIKLIERAGKLRIIGVDNLNDYYDVSLKEYRLKLIESAVRNDEIYWKFIKGNIADKNLLNDIFIE